MALDVNTFPLVISVQEDGQLVATISGIETLMTGAADRAGRAFQRAGQTANSSFKFDAARRDVEKFAESIGAFQGRAAQKNADPLGIRASIAALGKNPFQRILDEQASAEAALNQQRSRAQTELFREAEAQGKALIALDQQRLAASAALVAGPAQSPSTLYFDPKGSQAAAAAARIQANALEEVARAAATAATATNTATASDRAFAVSARAAATAAGIEAQRLEEVAATHGRVAAAAAAAGGKATAASILVTNSVRAQRYATLQSAAQFQDFFVQIAGGQSVLLAFSQQASQLAFVLADVGGTVGKFATFLATGWGTAILGAVTIAGLLVNALTATADAQDGAASASDRHKKAVDALKEAVDRLAASSAFANRQTEQGIKDDLARAESLRQREIRTRGVIDAELKLAKTKLQEAQRRSVDPTLVGEGGFNPGAVAAADFSRQAALLDAQAAENKLQISNANKAIAAGRAQLVLRNVAAATDPATAATQRYDRAIDSLQRKFERGAFGNPDTAPAQQKFRELALAATQARDATVAALSANRSGSRGARGQSSNDNAAARAAQQLAKYGDTAAESIKRISAQFDDQPRLIDRAAASTRELDAIIKDLGQRKPPGFQTLIADAERAKVVVENGLTKPYRDVIEAQQEQYQIGQLVLAGRESEADALSIILQLQRQGVSVDEAQRKTILANVQSLKDQNSQQRLSADLIDAQVRAAQQLQSAFTDLLSDPFAKGGLAKFGESLTQIRKRALGEQLSIQLVGDLGQKKRDELNGYKPLDLSADKLNAAADGHKSAAEKWIETAGRVVDIITAGVGGRGPSAAQLATTPTAFSSEQINALFSQVPGLTPDPAPGPDGPDIVVVGKRLAKATGDLAATTDKTVKKEDEKGKRDFRQSAALTMLASAIGGKGGAFISSVQNIQDYKKLGDTISSSIGGKLGKVLGGGVNGLGVGQAVGAGFDLVGLKGGSTGASIGGAIGGAASQVFGKALGALGPVAGLIGSVVGGLFGALFTKTPTGSAGLSTSNGSAVAGPATGTSAAVQRQATSLAGSVADSINTIAQTFGAKVTGTSNVQIGTYDDRIRVNPTGGDVGGKDNKAAVDFGKDEKAAIEFAVKDAINDGIITGLRDSTKRIIQAGTDLNRQLQKAVDFENVFIELKGYIDPVGAAIDSVDRRFDALRNTFAEAGASTEEYAQLEQLYGIKRTEAVKQAQQNLSGQLQSLLDDLRFKGDSGLSLRTRESTASSTFNALADQVSAGGKVDQDKFSEAARSYLDISRQIYGSTTTYFDRLASVTALTSTAITNAGNADNVVGIGSKIADATTTPANDNEALAASLAQALAGSIDGIAIPQDRIAQFTDAQFSDLVTRSIQTASAAPGGAGQSNADVIAAMNRQNDLIAAQTAQLSSRFDLLISTTSALDTTGGGRAYEGGGFSGSLTLRNA